MLLRKEIKVINLISSAAVNSNRVLSIGCYFFRIITELGKVTEVEQVTSLPLLSYFLINVHQFMTNTEEQVL